jgi:hypothetical protein
MLSSNNNETDTKKYHRRASKENLLDTSSLLPTNENHSFIGNSTCYIRDRGVTPIKITSEASKTKRLRDYLSHIPLKENTIE